MLLGCIADDFTGASDLANTLAKGGMRTVQFAGVVREGVKAPDHAALLLASHGPVVAGTSLESAVFAAEELEETAKLVVITNGLRASHLTAGQVADLNVSFKLK